MCWTNAIFSVVYIFFWATPFNVWKIKFIFSYFYTLSCEIMNENPKKIQSYSYFNDFEAFMSHKLKVEIFDIFQIFRQFSFFRGRANFWEALSKIGRWNGIRCENLVQKSCKIVIFKSVLNIQFITCIFTYDIHVENIQDENFVIITK